MKLIDSPVSRRGRSSLDAGRGSTPYSKVATSPARASTISTTKIGSNDVSNTVHTDVRPMSVIFRRALVRTHFRTRSSRRGHRVSCRDHIFFSRSREFDTRRVFTARGHALVVPLLEKLATRRASHETTTGTTTSKRLRERRCRAATVLHVNLAASARGSVT